ncbi:MAG: type II toxin-antitoxin system VapC family toxin [Gaiellaceae bacterium]
MIVLDTTVLVYAVGADHPLRAPTTRLVAAIRDGHVHATTTVEVIQEFAHVSARRRDRSAAVSLARDFASLLSPLLVADEQVLDQGLRLFARQPLGAFDAVLAATALENRADALVSADTAFAGIPGLRHVAPDTARFERLLD